jgi:hypothetical protein
MNWLTRVHGPAPNNTRSPFAAPVSARIAPSVASSRNFAIGELIPSRP